MKSSIHWIHKNPAFFVFIYYNFSCSSKCSYPFTLSENQDFGPGGPNLTTNHLLNTVTFILSLKMTDYDKSVFGGQVKTH